MLRPSQRHFATENLDPRLRGGLVAHYIGGGSGLTVFDRSSPAHGQVTGPLWTLGADGQRAALSFDGVDDKVQFPTTSANVSPPLTVSAWIKPARITGVILQYFLSKGFTGGAGWAFGLDGTLTNTAKVFAYNNVDLAYGPSALQVGRWHHVAFVNVGGQTTVYTDGIGTTTALTISNDPGRGVLFGDRGDTPFPFMGSIDTDVRIYSRALSPAEIILLARPVFLPVLPRRWYWPRPIPNVRRTIALSGSRASYQLAGSRSSHQLEGSRASYHIEGS